MKTDFIHTENKSFKSHLISCFEDCEELFFSVAFASRQGLAQIKNEFEELMKSGGAARFCFDVTQGMTDPDVIEELATYPGESSVRMLFYNGRNKVSLYLQTPYLTSWLTNKYATICVKQVTQ